jgi:phosphoribosylaminoimidazole carboxylase PurE protein
VNPLVGVVMGSASDRTIMAEAVAMLERFGIPSETVVLSAHRQPDATRRYAQQVEERGLKVLIAGAGLAAHLPGVLASHTTLPVIGVPIPGSTLGGLDSLLSIAQMPSGIPVATVSLGVPGARNAALLAAEILALGDDQMRVRLRDYRSELADAGSGAP